MSASLAKAEFKMKGSCPKESEREELTLEIILWPPQVSHCSCAPVHTHTHQNTQIQIKEKSLEPSMTMKLNQRKIPGPTWTRNMAMWWNSPRPPCLTGTVMKNLLPSLENTGSSFYNGERHGRISELRWGTFYSASSTGCCLILN